MRNPGGYSIITTPVSQIANFDGLRCEEVKMGMHETDTFTCYHCNHVVHVKPRMDPADLGGLCKSCMKLICPQCLNGGCTPFEKAIEALEKKQIALRSYGF